MFSFKKPAYVTALCTALIFGLSACGETNEDADKAEQIRGVVKDITAKATTTASDVASKTAAKASEVAAETGDTLQKAGTTVTEVASDAVEHVQDRIKTPSVSKD